MHTPPRRIVFPLVRGALLVTGATALLGLPVLAVDRDWDGGGGVDNTWGNALNWTGDVLPGVGDNAFINAPVSKVILLDATPPSATVNEISLARSGDQTITVNQTGGTLTANSWFTLGQGFGGAPNQGGGVWNMTNASVLNLSHSAGGQTVVGVGFTGSPNFNTGILSLADNAVLNQNLADIRIGGEDGARRAHGTVSVTGNAQLLHTGAGSLIVGNGTGSAFLNVGGGTVSAGGGGLTVGNNTVSTGTVVLSGGRINATGPLKLGGDAGAGHGTVIHSGGTLNVTGAYVAIGTAGTGSYHQSGGTFTFTGGSGFNVGDRSGSRGVMTLSAGTVNATQLFLGKTGTAAGALHQSGGVFTLGGTGEHKLGGNNGQTAAYGYVGLSGGTLNFAANNPQIGAGGMGVVRQSGGAFNTAGWTAVGRFGGAVGLLDVSGGTFTHNSASTTIIVGEDGTGTLNVRGTGALTLGPVTGGGFGLRLGHTGAAAGVLNLSGGTVTAPAVTRGTGSGVVNFNGGTLRANAASANFLTGLNAAYVHAGGGVIDAQGHAITIAQPLLAPTGNGVTGISSFTGGAGYLGAPLVTVVPGGGDVTGTGATAMAEFNPATGQVTGITITNPGVNYTATPTFVLSGGGFTSAATVTGAAPAANAGGGLTIHATPSGSVTLSGANTYTGVTTVNGGTVFMANPSALGTAAGGTVINAGATVHSNLNGLTLAENVTLNAGTLRQGGAPATDPVLNGTLSATGAATLRADGGASWTVNGNVDVSGPGSTLTVHLDGSETTAINGTISGAGGITKASSGILSLTQASNTYTGPTAINGGTLLIATGSEQTLGNNPGAYNPAQLSLNAGTLSVTGSSLTLNDTNRGVTVGVGSGTFSVASGLTLSLDNNLSAGAIGSTFTKTGAGTFNLTGNAQVNALVVDGGAYNQNAGSTEVLTTSTGLQIRSGGSYLLNGGSLKTDFIDVQSGGAFTWNGGTLTLRSTTGNAGAVDHSSPTFQPVRSGVTGEINGDLVTSAASLLALHGSPTLYLNDGVRFNNWAVDGDVDLSAGGDTLEFELNPYLLRPFSGAGASAVETGSLPLLTWTGTFGGGEFDVVNGINTTQGGGFNESGFAVTDPASLNANTWYIEYDAAAQTVWFHYKVNGYVPEPGSFALMLTGAFGLRLLRARRPRPAA